MKATICIRCVVLIAVAINALQPGKVLNGLNARQSEIFTEFSLNDSFMVFLMVFDVSLEMQSDSKSYVSVQDDEITELVHTIKSVFA